MAKVFTFITIIIAIFAVFALFGIADSNTSQLLKAISFDNPEDMKAFDLFALVFSSNVGVIATLAGAGAIIVGLFTRQTTESILLAGFTSVIASWIIGDMISIITTANAIYSSTFPAFGSVIKIMFAMFVGSFMIAILEWWRGSD